MVSPSNVGKEEGVLAAALCLRSTEIADGELESPEEARDAHLPGERPVLLPATGRVHVRTLAPAECGVDPVGHYVPTWVEFDWHFALL